MFPSPSSTPPRLALSPLPKQPLSLSRDGRKAPTKLYRRISIAPCTGSTKAQNLLRTSYSCSLSRVHSLGDGPAILVSKCRNNLQPGSATDQWLPRAVHHLPSSRPSDSSLRAGSSPTKTMTGLFGVSKASRRPLPLYAVTLPSTSLQRNSSFSQLSRFTRPSLIPTACWANQSLRPRGCGTDSRCLSPFLSRERTVLPGIVYIPSTGPPRPFRGRTFQIVNAVPAACYLPSSLSAAEQAPAMAKGFTYCAVRKVSKVREVHVHVPNRPS